METVFFDTNVLIYQFDVSNKAKQVCAENLVVKHLSQGTGSISTQVVQEFINVSTRKFAKPLSISEVQRFMTIALEPLCKHQPSTSFYLSGLNLHSEHSLSFYDALIVQAAIDLKCKILYSEDLQHGQKFGELTVINPFV